MMKNFKYFFQGKKEEDTGKNVQYTKISREKFTQFRLKKELAFDANQEDYKQIIQLLKHKNESITEFGDLHFFYGIDSDININIYKYEDHWYYLRIIDYSPNLNHQITKYYECDELTGLLNCIKNEILTK